MAALIGTRSVEAIAACFSRSIEFRALVSPGRRERRGAENAAALVAGWFADSTELDLVESGDVIDHADLLCSGFRPRIGA